jgi:DNA-binding transcriptional regulator YiaG
LGLYETGVIDKAAMKGFDATCLIPSELSPGAIKKLRTATGISA